MRNLLIWLLFSPLAQALPAQDYAHLMPLLPQHEGGQHRLVLPAEVYLHLMLPELADLRIYNASGESLPFALSGTAAEPVAKPALRALNSFALPEAKARSADLRLSVKLRADGTLSAAGLRKPQQGGLPSRYLIDASQLLQPVQALEIEAHERNGLHYLTLEGSDDLRDWRTLAVHAPWLALASDSGQVSQKRVEFSPVRCRYFRLSWEDAPVSLAKVEAEIAARAPLQYLQHLVQLHQSEPKAADYLFELPPSIGLERVRLLLPQPDSVASVSFFARSSTNDRWQPVSSATFYRITRDGAEINSAPHLLQGFRYRYWRVHFDRYSAQLPPELPLEIAWHPHQLVFLATGSAPYTLAFGNARAKAASFPLAVLMPGYQAADWQKLPIASLGAMVSQAPVAASLMDKLREPDWKKVLLWTLLSAGVALLGWMAWSIKKGLTQR